LPVDRAARQAKHDEEARGEAEDRRKETRCLPDTPHRQCFRHRDQESANRRLPPLEIGVTISMSVSLSLFCDGQAGRSGKVRKMSAPVGDRP
jgi:hypothetical protein